MNKKLAIGIDLGTSNCAVSYQLLNLENGSTTKELSATELLQITQVSGPDQIEKLDLMPSCIYIATDDEVEGGHFSLPGTEESQRFLIGKAAREKGSSVADRVVFSAKSWLCNTKIDRRSEVLPWKSDLAEYKVSPVRATELFLAHIHRTIRELLQESEIESLNECEVTITVPASFDEVARTLTVEAAEKAGFQQITLLEEPLAAFYSWIAESGPEWRKSVQPGDVVLVCDVGGGTADFSLIAVTEQEGDLQLERISVGDHILLGGDNMDLALAYYTKAKLQEEGSELDDWQFQTLIHLCRTGKERLLEEKELESYSISIPSRGSDLFAENVSTQLAQEEIERIIVAGFFPEVDIHAKPNKARRAGLREVGLPYATDAALSKHLAEFLTTSLSRLQNDPDKADIELPIGDSHIIPTAVLFNGGVFNADRLRHRMLQILRSWAPTEVRELEGINRDKAVAKGAASFAITKATGDGLRIRSGTTKAYYIGIESAAPAVPGFAHPLQGVCVLPHGTEEGTELSIEDLTFSLYTGEESQFKLFSSADRPADGIGETIRNAEESLEGGLSVHSNIPTTSSDTAEGELVNVRLHAKVTEVGVLELWMHDIDSEAKWKLEFNIRPNE